MASFGISGIEYLNFVTSDLVCTAEFIESNEMRYLVCGDIERTGAENNYRMFQYILIA
jgi:hypothetical protein